VDRKVIISKVMQKLAEVKKPEYFENFLKVLKDYKDPEKLFSDLQKNTKIMSLQKQDSKNLLFQAKKMGIFKKHFTIPHMEKSWRLWAKEQGLSGEFMFEI